jgi:DNA-binding PadR family transcriptional regulator
MTPIERFKNSISEGNLWICVIYLAKNQEIINEDVPRLVFEKFGFMPNGFLVARVMFSLKRNGFISEERHAGKKAYRSTQKGIEQLTLAQDACGRLLEKLAK